jgi:hypothetical protein
VYNNGINTKLVSQQTQVHVNQAKQTSSAQKCGPNYRAKPDENIQRGCIRNYTNAEKLPPPPKPLHHHQPPFLAVALFRTFCQTCLLPCDLRRPVSSNSLDFATAFSLTEQGRQPSAYEPDINSKFNNTIARDTLRRHCNIFSNGEHT